MSLPNSFEEKGYSSVTDNLLAAIRDLIAGGSGTGGGSTAQYNTFSIVEIEKGSSNTFAPDTCHCIRLINPEGTSIGAILAVEIDGSTISAVIENVPFEMRATGLIHNEVTIGNKSNQILYFITQK
jgi:hypothetical protein